MRSGEWFLDMNPLTAFLPPAGRRLRYQQILRLNHSKGMNGMSIVHNFRCKVKRNTIGARCPGHGTRLQDIGILLHLLWPLSQRAQVDAHSRQDSTFILNAARDVMNKARYCALITSDGAGCPHVRIMDPFSPDEGLIVWFGTNRNSRKVQGPFSTRGQRVTADRAIGLGSVDAAAAVDTLGNGPGCTKRDRNDRAFQEKAVRQRIVETSIMRGLE